MPAAEMKKLVDGELGLTMDPSLLRGATADLLIKNRSEIFSSNVLSQKDLAQLHESTAIVSFLDSFFSHSWRTARLDKWAGLLLYLNAQAAALAMVAGTVFWALLEDFELVPRLLVYYYEDRHMMVTGMPVLVGIVSGVVFLINWQRIRKFFGLGPRYCFLDKVCIDQVDEVRKSAGIASLGAFLGSAENFVVLFSPDYFSRLWCCYELAAFRHLQVAGKQKITFLPLAFPRVLFANAVAIAAACVPHAFISVFGPWLGIDINNVSTNFYGACSYPGSLLWCWTMYECQRYVDARDMIDEQLENFSITKTECHDEKDRPRVEREIAKWFGDGDRDEGIRKFDEYVKTDVRELIEDMVGKRKPFSSGIPWLYILLSSTCAILEDISMFANIYQVHGLWDRVFFAMSPLTCILVGTPMVPVLLLWCASKEYRVGGKGPMIFLAPLIGWIPTYFLIVGFVTPNPTFCLIQFPLVLAFGAVVFRDSIANLLGLNKQRKVQKKQYVQLPTHSYGSNL